MAMFRVTSSKVVLGAVRVISSRANSRHFCTVTKKQIHGKLVNIIKSEIELKKIYTCTYGPNHPDPKYFFFTIKGSPWAEHMTMSREFQGEKIDVIVNMPSCSHFFGSLNIDDNNSDSDGDINSPNHFEPHLLVTVKVSKEKGAVAEFDVVAYADERMKISKYSLVEPASKSGQPLRKFGPYSVDDKGELQNALMEYLRIRGIEEGDFKFFFETMIWKNVHDPVESLEGLSKFIRE